MDEGIRVPVANPGLNGLDRGAQFTARSRGDAGREVAAAAKKQMGMAGVFQPCAALDGIARRVRASARQAA
jgi:methylmalonyl-CoA mutase cobalamin-binding subunit